MRKDQLAGGAPSASFGPIRVSTEAWEKIFGKAEPAAIAVSAGASAAAVRPRHKKIQAKA